MLMLVLVEKCRCRVRHDDRRCVEGQVKGLGQNASRLRPKDLKKAGGVTSGPHNTWTNKEVRVKKATVLGRVGKDDGEVE